MLKQSDQAADFLRALSHPGRLRILCLLHEGKQTVSELVKGADLPQSIVSQFLARMKAEGLVQSQREGRFVHYELSDLRVSELLQALKRSFCPS